MGCPESSRPRTTSFAAERASGYRYSSRAYLIQLRRAGAGSWLIDPIPLQTLQPLAQALDGAEWILHAATQDLPCLRELGLQPSSLFDTELAGRLLNYPRVGLATLVESIVGLRMRKEHSAADWSTRPLPEPWLEYAALDVEVLVELREHLAHRPAVGALDGSRLGGVPLGSTDCAVGARSVRHVRCGRRVMPSPPIAM